MPQHVIDTNADPIVIEAEEVAPGLRVFELPPVVGPLSEYRWVLAHHEGAALASFADRGSALAGGEAARPLTDWTRNAITCANAIGPSGMKELTAALVQLGGAHPNA